MELCFDALMVWAFDEPDAVYCALAETVELSADRNVFRFALRPQARFHDGSPITASDVAFSIHSLKRHGHPQISLPLVHMTEAVAIDDHTVELRFDGSQSDRAILYVMVYYRVFSARYYETRDFSASTLEPPLGSGPWKVGNFKVRNFIEYDRVDDYWARDLPFARGLDHFDHLRIDFFTNRQAAFEAFKKGKVRWREEFTSKIWATGYDFPARKDGRVVMRLFDDEKRPTMQAWAINTRKGKFANIATRQAISLCFDFEWTNNNLFYQAYTRSSTLFETSELKASGEPGVDELALLEPFRDQVPETVFGQALEPFVTDGSGEDRRPIARAFRLLHDAGWRPENGKLVDQTGRPLTIEFLIRSPTFERVLGKYVKNLALVGIEATIRLVDPAQFQSRIDAFDFDVVGLAFSLPASPTADGLRQFFHSKAASKQGSRNYPGIALTPIDAMLDALGRAENRQQLITAMHTLDRLLRAYHFWIPNWYSANHRVAMWDMFDWKEPKPEYDFPVERLWWVDPVKARAIDEG